MDHLETNIQEQPAKEEVAAINLNPSGTKPVVEEKAHDGVEDKGRRRRKPMGWIIIQKKKRSLCS